MNSDDNTSRANEDIEILEPVDSGLVGRIYKGRQKSLERIVAVKVIKPDFQDKTTALAHALPFAKVGTHPNFVPVYLVTNVLMRRDPILIMPAMIMDWIEGITLGKRLERTPNLSRDEAVYIANGVLDGIDFMHSKGVVHGDLHAGNIILADGNTPKILDINANEDVFISDRATGSREDAIETDVKYCASVIIRTLMHTNLPFPLWSGLEGQLRSASRIAQLREFLSDFRNTSDYVPSEPIASGTHDTRHTNIKRLASLSIADAREEDELKSSGLSHHDNSHNWPIEFSTLAIADAVWDAMANKSTLLDLAHSILNNDDFELMVSPVLSSDGRQLPDFVRILKVAHTRIDDEIAPQLSVFEKLKKLTLGHTAVGTKVVNACSRLPLLELDLSGCKNVDDESLFHFWQSSSSLLKLCLEGTEVTSEGLKHLVGLKKLELLLLDGTNFANLSVLAPLLPENGGSLLGISIEGSTFQAANNLEVPMLAGERLRNELLLP